MKKIIVYVLCFPFILCTCNAVVASALHPPDSIAWALGSFVGVLILMYPVLVVPALLVGILDAVRLPRRVRLLLTSVLGFCLTAITAWWVVGTLDLHKVAYFGALGFAAAIGCWYIAERFQQDEGRA